MKCKVLFMGNNMYIFVIGNDAVHKLCRRSFKEQREQKVLL